MERSICATIILKSIHPLSEKFVAAMPKQLSLFSSYLLCIWTKDNCFFPSTVTVARIWTCPSNRNNICNGNGKTKAKKKKRRKYFQPRIELMQGSWNETKKIWTWKNVNFSCHRQILISIAISVKFLFLFYFCLYSKFILFVNRFNSHSSFSLRFFLLFLLQNNKILLHIRFNRLQRDASWRNINKYFKWKYG